MALVPPVDVRLCQEPHRRAFCSHAPLHSPRPSPRPNPTDEPSGPPHHQLASKFEQLEQQSSVLYEFPQ
eukprot:scaffold78889_cov38-Prasinocladus_malaysianus.AAC.1